MPVREPCLGFDLARPCPPVASLRLCALGTSARLHRRITALSPSRDHPWPNSGRPLSTFGVRVRTATQPPRAQLLYRAMQLRSQTLTAAICPAGPIVVFPFRAPRLGSPGLARPGLVPPTFNQINLACRFRPRARALSLSTSPLLPLTYAALRSARRRSRP